MPLLKHGWPHWAQHSPFLTASSVTGAGRAHRITAFTLMKDETQDHCSEESGRSILTYDGWCTMKAWHFTVPVLALDVERVILSLIRSLRKRTGELYGEALTELIAPFFANSNVNYARWLPTALATGNGLRQERHIWHICWTTLPTVAVGNWPSVPVRKLHWEMHTR